MTMEKNGRAEAGRSNCACGKPLASAGGGRLRCGCELSAPKPGARTKTAADDGQTAADPAMLAAAMSSATR